ncbi:uncharacterized protein TNCV_671181 [Trichonephila clavipes]|nr:uncharacterized protein TNCV_671181 [Trichonephila clavipes]
MSKQMVHRWCRQFLEGCQSVHNEERSGRPSLIKVDLVELVRQRVMENRHFTITELSSQFIQISQSLLHEIVTKHPPAVQKIEDVCHMLVPFTGGRVLIQNDTKVDTTILSLDKRLNSGGDSFEK